jgi:transcriptional regulator with XRE-family HTH domain
MSRKLTNYLRTYRKRAGLTQGELAFLLGCRNGAKVSRYERLQRVPTLQTALAYEAVLGVPARELFAGMFEEIQRTAKRRVRSLIKRLGSNQRPKVLRKLETLQATAGKSSH